MCLPSFSRALRTSAGSLGFSSSSFDSASTISSSLPAVALDFLFSVLALAAFGSLAFFSDVAGVLFVVSLSFVVFGVFAGC